MGKRRYEYYSIGLLLLIGLFFNPAFAEVTSIQTNNELFYKDQQIEFSGTVEENSIGLVTIVVRDLNDEFLLLTQAVINHDNTFTKSIEIDKRFSKEGVYSASGFILNMTKEISSEFNVSFNKTPTLEKIVSQEPIQQNVIVEDKMITNTENNDQKLIKADFVDSNKDPLYYVERYYTEPYYKSWFEQNYPKLTIEEAVGYTGDFNDIKISIQEIENNNIIPEAQASSIIKPSQEIEDNSDIAEMSLAIAGVGILFGAVYGVKRQVDSNSKQISLNRDIIKRKIIKPIRGSNPKEILQTRLAKGEITLEEYENLERKMRT